MKVKTIIIGIEIIIAAFIELIRPDLFIEITSLVKIRAYKKM